MKKIKKEKRKYQRKEILESFQVYLTIPHLGPHKLYFKDISKGGIGILTEDDTLASLDVGLECPAFLHFNQALKFPLDLRITNRRKDKLPNKKEIDVIGCVVSFKKSAIEKMAYEQFVDLVDTLSEIQKVEAE